jgi:hypothetical protein
MKVMRAYGAKSEQHDVIDTENDSFHDVHGPVTNCGDGKSRVGRTQSWARSLRRARVMGGDQESCQFA